MEKFTKGPWVQGNPTDKAPFCIDARCNNDGAVFEVCSVWGVNRDDVACFQSEANASLIAAAPEMYDFIKSIQLDSASDEIKRDNLLAKARGE